jgi:uncharacterized protein
VAAVLLVSLSGIRTGTLDACATLIADLDARRVPVSLLVVPRDPGGRAALRWLRQRRDRGDALLMHGYDHTADPLGPWGTYTVASLRRRAEFATLPAHEAGLRLHAASLLLERFDLRTDAFAPPRGLASPGTLQALRQRGYRVCAEAAAVRDLRSGQVHRGRELGFGMLGLAPGERTTPLWCRAIARGVARAVRQGALVRIAADARDLASSGRRAALLAAVDLALHHRAHPGTYRTLTERQELAV